LSNFSNEFNELRNYVIDYSEIADFDKIEMDSVLYHGKNLSEYELKKLVELCEVHLV
jgi:hypothetical protein